MPGLKLSCKQSGKLNAFSNRVVLISAPWPIFSRPSIQLGALKAYIKNQLPETDCRAYHFFLNVAADIGYGIYQSISERSWLSESIYAAILYPERFEKIERFFAKKSRNNKNLSNLNFTDLINQVKKTTDTFIREINWKAFDLVGISACLCQLTSSLYFIKEIKTKAPDLPVILGGSITSGQSATDILTAFPQIDIIVVGEGEQPMVRLIEHLNISGTLNDFPRTPGVFSRQIPRQSGEIFCQLPNLEKLPPPDYQEYFNLLKTFAPEKTFFPTLPAEISRGCWWRKLHHHGKETGCAFCNLNLQWQGYRTKSKEQVVSEIDQITSRYQLLSIAFMDNALPPKGSRQIFEALSDLNKDFCFFSEIRASTNRQTLEKLAKAGMNEVQIGIEALCTSLLKKLNKGTTSIENMEIMKNCEALGIRNISNLILSFPGSDVQDVNETLRALKFARIFQPLRIVRFWLGMESPVWKHPQQFGITSVFNHPGYRILFPEKIYRHVHFIMQDYRGDKTDQKRLWQPVKDAVSDWKTYYEQLHSHPGSGPILSYLDGKDFIIIKERKPDDKPVNHRLTGISRQIYLYCDHRRTIQQILAKFPSLSEDKLLPFLRMMTQKRLMFDERETYLSLAVSARN